MRGIQLSPFAFRRIKSVHTAGEKQHTFVNHEFISCLHDWCLQHKVQKSGLLGPFKGCSVFDDLDVWLVIVHEVGEGFEGWLGQDFVLVDDGEQPAMVLEILHASFSLL